jgi:hypothetical protein
MGESDLLLGPHGEGGTEQRGQRDPSDAPMCTGPAEPMSLHWPANHSPSPSAQSAVAARIRAPVYP